MRGGGVATGQPADEGIAPAPGGAAGQRRWPELVKRLLIAGCLVAGGVLAQGLYCWDRYHGAWTYYLNGSTPPQGRLDQLIERVDGQLFLHSVAAVVTRGAGSDEEKLRRIFHWTCCTVEDGGGGVVIADDPSRAALRGTGFCDQSAAVLATVAHYSGLNSRLYFLRGPNGTSWHTVAQVMVSGKWILVDTTWNRILTRRDGSWATLDDVLADPDRLAFYLGPGKRLPGLRRVQDVAAAYGRGTPFASFPYAPLPVTLQRAFSRLRGAPSYAAPARVEGAPASPETDARLGRRIPLDTPRGERLREFLNRLDGQRRLHLLGHLGEAGEGYRTLLAQSETLDAPYDAEARGLVYYYLGRLADAQGRTTEANEMYSYAARAGLDPARRTRSVELGRGTGGCGDREGPQARSGG
jgi:hypothetical protein